MNINDVAAFIKTAPIETLRPAAEALAWRLLIHRQTHDGWTPRELFLPCLTIGGLFGSFEFVIEVTDAAGNSIGYALRKRSGSDIDYTGPFHIMGVWAKMNEGPRALRKRASEELGGLRNREIETLLSHSTFLGIALRYEEGRQARCWAITEILCIDELAFKCLEGEWEIFRPPFDDPRIIKYHRQHLRWATQTTPPPIADLADYPDP